MAMENRPRRQHPDQKMGGGGDKPEQFGEVEELHGYTAIGIRCIAGAAGLLQGSRGGNLPGVAAISRAANLFPRALRIILHVTA
jgi:hypothetical protein